jgi:hypothetical protein
MLPANFLATRISIANDRMYGLAMEDTRQRFVLLRNGLSRWV